MLRFSLCSLVCAFTLWPAPIATSPPQEAKLGPGRKYSTVERVQLDRLRAVHEARLRYSGARREVALRSGYEDYRAILHAHAEDAAHTGGTRPELLAAAKQTGVRIVMLTDHVRPQRDFINDSWRGLRDGVLFIPGAEAEGFLAYPQRSIKGESFTSREGYIALIKRDGGNIFLSHVEERFDWPTEELDGIEIYNNHTDIKDEGPFLSWLRGALTDPGRLAQLQSALSDYPQEFFGASQDYLAPIIAKWDRDLASHSVTGVAANDCHHNQGFIVTVAGPNAIEISEMVDGGEPRRVTAEQAPRVAEMVRGRNTGDIVARLDIDPYDRSMRYVTTHILAHELTEVAVRQALRSGHAYVAHDWLCDPTGFVFAGSVGSGQSSRAVMGDEIALRPGLGLRVEAPVAGTVKLFRNGVVIKETHDARLEWPVTEPGVYRVEIWLELDGEMRPWIYANAIRVRRT